MIAVPLDPTAPPAELERALATVGAGLVLGGWGGNGSGGRVGGVGVGERGNDGDCGSDHSHAKCRRR